MTDTDVPPWLLRFAEQMASKVTLTLPEVADRLGWSIQKVRRNLTAAGDKGVISIPRHEIPCYRHGASWYVYADHLKPPEAVQQIKQHKGSYIDLAKSGVM